MATKQKKNVKGFYTEVNPKKWTFKASFFSRKQLESESLAEV